MSAHPLQTYRSRGSRVFQSPKLLAKAASAMPASMAQSALRVAAITNAAPLTPSAMCGAARQAVGTTMEISTDTDMYFRKVSTRGVTLTWDIIQTPPTRVARVTAARRSTVPIAAIALMEVASAMSPHPDDAA